MLNIISPINQLGYGVAGLNICKELDNIDPVALWTIGQPSVTSQEDHGRVTEMIKNAKTPDFHAPCIRIWHQHDMSQFVGNNIKIGFPIFELDNFNDLELHHLNSLDRIFVCSEWARQVVINKVNISPESVHVIPLGVDSDVFKKNNLDNEHSDATIFFNCGKWEVRKGHDIIPEAFCKAFTEEDNVELWMMCENPFNSPDEKAKWQDMYTSCPLGSKVRLLDRVETQDEVYNIMSNTTCGVFPARAEGWNLELLEMMACNKPVITTNYSAHTEFCTKDNSFLVPIDEEEMAYDGKWFNGEVGKWAKLGSRQISKISEHMKFVHKHNITTNPQGVETATKYSWRNSAETIREALQDV
jgi:glycosyltransferase involved in cell wall biosynthesis